MPGPIATRFVETHPADAARILEREHASIVGELLGDLPPAAAARLLRAMTPHVASDGIARLRPETAAAMVSHLRTESAVSLLLRLNAATRTALLKALPASTSAALRLALRFPAGSVGSLIDPDVMTVRADTRFGETVEVVRRAPVSLRKYLYVLDENHRLAGVLDARQCVFQEAGRLVGSINLDEPVALRARASLRQASLSEAWERFDVLPVTDHRGVFLGVVRRRSLFGAVPWRRRPGQDQALGNLAFDLVELFWGTTSSLVFGGKSKE